MAMIVKIKTVIKEDGGLATVDCWLNLDTVCFVRESKKMGHYYVSTIGGSHTVLTEDAKGLIEGLEALSVQTMFDLEDTKRYIQTGCKVNREG